MADPKVASTEPAPPDESLDDTAEFVLCPKCNAPSTESHETGWRICLNLHRFQQREVNP
jgi:hypothetical protein